MVWTEQESGEGRETGHPQGTLDCRAQEFSRCDEEITGMPSSLLHLTSDPGAQLKVRLFILAASSKPVTRRWRYLSSVCGHSALGVLSLRCLPAAVTL